jgi:hypothetical protein
MCYEGAYHMGKIPYFGVPCGNPYWSQRSAGTISLAELKDFIVAATWQIPATEGPEARQLAYDIELALAKESSGHLTDDEPWEDLRGILNRYPVKTQV